MPVVISEKCLLRSQFSSFKAHDEELHFPVPSEVRYGMRLALANELLVEVTSITYKREL